MASYKNHKKQLMEFSHWLLMALIALLWVNFALFKGNGASIDTAVGIKSMANLQTASANKSIADFHIFGSAQQLYDVPLSQNNTSLKLTLNGTMSQSDVKSGLAYISNVQGVQGKFKVGEKVYNVATLVEIHKTYVLLDNNGKKEKLSLPEKLSQNTSKRQTANNNQRNKSANSKHIKTGNAPNWDEMMQQQKFDPSKISNIVNNSNLVVDQSGSIQGIRVSNLSSGAVDLARVGLKPSDIITAVNGNKISGNNLLSLGKTIQENPTTVVTIKRNGKIHNIQININDL